MGFTAGDTLELLRACEPRACELLALLRRRCSGVARGRSCRSRCRLKTEEGLVWQPQEKCRPVVFLLLIDSPVDSPGFSLCAPEAQPHASPLTPHASRLPPTCSASPTPASSVGPRSSMLARIASQQSRLLRPLAVRHMSGEARPMTRFVQAITAARSPTPALAPTPRTTRALLRHCARVSAALAVCGRLPICVSPPLPAVPV